MKREDLEHLEWIYNRYWIFRVNIQRLKNS